MNDRKLKRVLRLPTDSKVLVLQTVGYPKEDARAGGQRPRLPFESRFFLNRCGEPFPRDERVVGELEREKMLQAPAPLPGRRDELGRLAKDYGLSDIFGDEVAAIIEDMTRAA